MANEIPESVKTYITEEMGLSLDKVIAHRVVNGSNPLYAVLMADKPEPFTIVFIAKYEARRPLGDYEEAFDGNAKLVGWECVSDGDPWEHSIARFKNAPYNMFPQ